MVTEEYRKEWQEQDHTFTAQLDRCSFMYPGYGTQVRISMDGDESNGGSKFVVIKKAPAECTDADIEDVLHVDIVQCTRCHGPRLAGSRTDTDLCEPCFLADLDKRFAAIEAKEARAQKRRDATKRKQGYTHRVIAWVHPAEGGDDQCWELYMRQAPTKAEMATFLSRHGSCIFNDYQVTPLTT